MTLGPKLSLSIGMEEEMLLARGAERLAQRSNTKALAPEDEHTMAFRAEGGGELYSS